MEIQSLLARRCLASDQLPDLLRPGRLYGHADLAADIADKTVANAIKNGISEHYDSMTGKPLGVRDYCMGCTLVTMMLDRLTQKNKLKLRDYSCKH